MVAAILEITQDALHVVSILLPFQTIQMPVCLPGQELNNVEMDFNKYMKGLANFAG